MINWNTTLKAARKIEMKTAEDFFEEIKSTRCHNVALIRRLEQVEEAKNKFKKKMKIMKKRKKDDLEMKHISNK